MIMFALLFYSWDADNVARPPGPSKEVVFTSAIRSLSFILSVRLGALRPQYCNALIPELYFSHMFLTGFRSFSRKHGRISNGALGRSSNTNLRRISYFVSTTLSTNFHAFSIPFRDPDSPLNVTSSPLIQLSLLRRNNNVFTSAIFQNFNFVSRCDRVLSWLRLSSLTMA
jgi:hypothetical protein